jgi:hypothetical protein
MPVQSLSLSVQHRCSERRDCLGGSFVILFPTLPAALLISWNGWAPLRLTRCTEDLPC